MAAIANAPAVSISAETYLETGIVIDVRNSPALSRAFDDLLEANASLSVLDADLSGLPPAFGRSPISSGLEGRVKKRSQFLVVQRHRSGRCRRRGGPADIARALVAHVELFERLFDVPVDE